MNILALDLSLTATGVATPTGELDTWATDDRQGDARLVDISDRLNLLLRRNPVTVAVIEDLPTHAHGAGKTAMVHGLVRERLLRRGIPIVLVVASQLKKYATGKGNATKPDMRVELLKRTGLDLRDDNQVDAWWLRAMALDAYGQPPVQLPAVHRDALAKITWPHLEAVA